MTGGPTNLQPRERLFIIAAALLALFLGAMDALIVSAAMPTIVAELGGLDLYAWVYSAYFLARAVSLPVFGKMADLFPTRTLFLVAIALFLFSSLLAGASPNMGFLIASRVLQGIGAGGNFALVYIVLADVAPPSERARTLALGSSVWGVASLLGPTLGGCIVNYMSWRWIFFINLPLGLFSLVGIGRFLVEFRPKAKEVHLDLAGVGTLTVTILALLTAFLVGGRTPGGWTAPSTTALLALSLLAGGAFCLAERRARDPILSLAFFANRGFRSGNGAVFLSSFAIFSLFAFAPLYIQGALGRSPVEVGMAMLSLSLGWSIGSIVMGRIIQHLGKRSAAATGALCLAAGGAATLFFSAATAMSTCFVVFLVLGIGMGFVTLSTLLVVQNSLGAADLGVATSSHQFARTLGGSVGVGVCGGFVTAKVSAAVDHLIGTGLLGGTASPLGERLRENAAHLFQPEIQAQLPQATLKILQSAVADGVAAVFLTVLIVSLACLICCLRLPPDPAPGRPLNS